MITRFKMGLFRALGCVLSHIRECRMGRVCIKFFYFPELKRDCQLSHGGGARGIPAAEGGLPCFRSLEKAFLRAVSMDLVSRVWRCSCSRLTPNSDVANLTPKYCRGSASCTKPNNRS